MLTHAFLKGIFKKKEEENQISIPRKININEEKEADSRREREMEGRQCRVGKRRGGGRDERRETKHFCSVIIKQGFSRY